MPTTVAFDEYFPFELGHGSTANSVRWRELFGAVIPDGVVVGRLNQLAPVYSLAAGTITVDTGACVLNGVYCAMASLKTLNVSGNGTVVASLNLTTLVASVNWVTTETEYPYTQNTTTYEMPLMTLIGGVATDIRPFVDQGAVSTAFANSAPAANLLPSTTINYGILGAHIPNPGTYLVEGTAGVSVALDASASQSLQAKLFANQGAFTAAPPTSLGPIKQLDWPGGGGAGLPYSASITGKWTLAIASPGYWVFGWNFVSGSGAPTCKILDLALRVSLIQAAIPSAVINVVH